jgi:hypothetical protein
MIVFAFISSGAFSFFVLDSRSAPAAPLEFHHSFNLYGDWTQYLHSATNAEVYTEVVAGHSTFWRPTQTNVWGEIKYKFPLGFTTTSATLRASNAVWTTGDPFPYDPGAHAILDVSPDGLNWTTLDHRQANNGGFAYGPYDITPHVDGASEIWVRSMLFGTTTWPVDGPIFAQFLRTNPGDTMPTFQLDVVGVPEPSALCLSVASVAIAGLFARRITA